MARSVGILRRQIRRMAGDVVGRNADWPGLWVGQVQSVGREAAIVAAPPDIDGNNPLIQPATGLPFFMVDVSGVDGPDPIA